MTDEIQVEPAAPADLPGAAALAARLVRQHHQADPARFFLPERVEEGYLAWFRQEIERAEAVIVVARAPGGEVAGYGYGTLEGRDWNLLLDRHGAIHDIYVAESARLRGVGRRLVEVMLRELSALGAPRVVLSTMVSNSAAQRLFAAAGFRPTMLEMTHGG